MFQPSRYESQNDSREGNAGTGGDGRDDRGAIIVGDVNSFILDLIWR